MATSAARTPKLAQYNKRRRFAVTPEPPGVEARSSVRRQKKAAKTAAKTGPIFVVQKHAASHLHYDFRLEHDGVLMSWAVPKGPSVRVAERRLAMRTEDHPLSYARFEGTIPEGEYGGGRVLVWDYGTWQVEGDTEKQVRTGRLTFTLHGNKLTGRFHLVRSKQQGARERWLLFKGKDAGAKDVDIVTERPESVLSGHTIEQVSGPVWHSNRAAPKRSPAAPKKKRIATHSGEREHAGEDAVLRAVSRLNLGFSLSSLDKVLYPEQGLRKGDLIAYIAAVAPRMLPHVAKRPLVLVRCPDGRGHQCFYQKHFDKTVPQALYTVEIDESDKRGHYGYVKDMPGLVALAQLGVLEIHMWGCHVDRVERPDLFVFDLDPDEGLPWQRVVVAAQTLRERLSALALESFVKTTGGKGLHVVVPVTRKWTWEEHKAIAYAIVADLARSEPQRYVTNMSKKARKGKIFLDYLRNGRGATAIAPYATRAREGALVATPISWQELAAGVEPSAFDVRGVVQRLQSEKRDPWQGFFALSQSLTAAGVRALLSADK